MRYLLLRLKRFCGFITGIVFFIGGLLKLLDPVGAGLVMKEYLDFLHIGFLGSASKGLGVIFAFAETLIGTGLITGICRKAFGIAAVSLQVFFTLLTLLLVIFNPEMDCGCFGEAIHLTHMQTFVKNLVLLALLSAYYFPAKMLGKGIRRKYVSFWLVTFSTAAFAIYSLMYIPLVDFTAYKPAAALKAADTVAAEDLYEAEFIYEKEGKEERFDLGHLPDSTWTFVRTETTAREGYSDEDLLDLSFYDNDGNYQDSLACGERVMAVSIYDPQMSGKKWTRTVKFVKNAQEAGFTVIILTSSEPERIDEATEKVLAPLMYYSDYKTLLSMNRSNGGITYFSDGYLVRKWAANAAPDLKELKKISSEDVTETIIGQNTKGSLGFQGFLLYVFAVMLLL